MPLAFEVNRGQLDDRILYAARGQGFSLALTRRAAVLGLARGAGHRRGAGLSVGFAGASPDVQLVGDLSLRQRVNYAIGRDPSRWHIGIPTFARVRYRHLWPGIDAEVHGDRGRLAYDFVLSPRADPSNVILALAGGRSIRAGDRGGLVIRLAGGGLVRQLAPHAYQLVAGRRRSVPVSYVRDGDRVGVRLARFDRRRALVIDPVLAYSTYLGGSDDDVGRAVAVDSSGAAYFAGLTLSTNYPALAGAPQTAFGGEEDAVVTKLDPSGTGLVYSTYLGGARIDEAHAIVVDPSGTAYVAGRTDSSDFPATGGAYQKAQGGGENAFVAKLGPSGQLIYATYFGGTGNTDAEGLAIDSTGAAYITGFAQSSTLSTTTGALQTTFGGGVDGYVAKFNASGSQLLYSTYLGGSGDDFARSIALDPGGAVYVTGATSSPNFPTTAGAMQAANAGASDAFVTKLSTTAFVLPFYSTYLGGAGNDSGAAIAVDASGEAYLTGETLSSNFPATPGALQGANAGGGDGFVTELNAAGTAAVYSTYLGGTGSDMGQAIALDSSRGAYVAGVTQSSDFPVTPGAVQATSAGNGDGFVSKLDPNGSQLLLSSYLGGAQLDLLDGAAVGTTGAAYLIGLSGSTDYPTSPGVFQPAPAGRRCGPHQARPAAARQHRSGERGGPGLGRARRHRQPGRCGDDIHLRIRHDSRLRSANGRAGRRVRRLPARRDGCDHRPVPADDLSLPGRGDERGRNGPRPGRDVHHGTPAASRIDAASRSIDPACLSTDAACLRTDAAAEAARHRDGHVSRGDDLALLPGSERHDLSRFRRTLDPGASARQARRKPDSPHSEPARDYRAEAVHARRWSPGEADGPARQRRARATRPLRQAARDAEDRRGWLLRYWDPRDQDDDPGPEAEITQKRAGTTAAENGRRAGTGLGPAGTHARTCARRP